MMLDSLWFRMCMALLLSALVWGFHNWKKLEADWKSELKALLLPVAAGSAGLFLMTEKPLLDVLMMAGETLLLAFGVTSAMRKKAPPVDEQQ